MTNMRASGVWARGSLSTCTLPVIEIFFNYDDILYFIWFFNTFSIGLSFTHSQKFILTCPTVKRFKRCLSERVHNWFTESACQRKCRNGWSTWHHCNQINANWEQILMTNWQVTVIGFLQLIRVKSSRLVPVLLDSHNTTVSSRSISQEQSASKRNNAGAAAPRGHSLFCSELRVSRCRPSVRTRRSKHLVNSLVRLLLLRYTCWCTDFSQDARVLLMFYYFISLNASVTIGHRSAYGSSLQSEWDQVSYRADVSLKLMHVENSGAPMNSICCRQLHAPGGLCVPLNESAAKYLSTVITMGDTVCLTFVNTVSRVECWIGHNCKFLHSQ